jgi:transposase
MEPFPGRNSVLVLDNASWNGYEATAEAFEAKGVLRKSAYLSIANVYFSGCRLLYNAPYCPELNPEEAAFRSLKMHLRATGVLDEDYQAAQDYPMDDLLKIVEEAIYEVMTPELMAKLFRGSGHF